MKQDKATTPPTTREDFEQMCGDQPSPSIPVNDDENNNLQKLADLLENRGVRKYLNINGFGYSQIERDIVELFQPPAQPIPVNDEIHAADIEDGINKDFGLCKKIAESYNHTYGEGYDPTVMEELYKALERIIDRIKENDLQENFPSAFDRAQTALQNAKTIKK